LINETQEYYEIKELFFDETEEKKSKSEIYSRMFFVWDYLQWWIEKYGAFTPDMTARSVYLEIGEKVNVLVNDETGRNATVEKDLQLAGELIDGGYKQFYKPKKNS